jgi:hypothetical protein
VITQIMLFDVVFLRDRVITAVGMAKTIDDGERHHRCRRDDAGGHGAADQFYLALPDDEDARSMSASGTEEMID